MGFPRFVVLITDDPDQPLARLLALLELSDDFLVDLPQPNGKLHTTACILHKKLGIFAVREALRARYSEKWELENPLVNLEFDSFRLSGECVTIRA